MRGRPDGQQDGSAADDFGGPQTANVGRDAVEPIAIGFAVGASCLGAGVVIGHFVALHGRVPGEIAEQKVEITELGENDILVLTKDGSVSTEMSDRIREDFGARLNEGGQLVAVISDGFKLSVVRRTWAPPKAAPPRQTPSHLPNYPIDEPLPVIPQPDPLEGSSAKPRKQTRRS